MSPSCDCGTDTETHDATCALVLAMYSAEELEAIQSRQLPGYTEPHDGQTEPSAWPTLDDEGFPF